MLYMSYVRIRSLRSPKGYTSEPLIKRPWMVMASFWVMGLLAWTPITFIFSTKDYNIKVNYTPFYLVTIFNLVSWFSVLLLIFSLSIIIIKELHLRKKIKQELKNDKRNSEIASHSHPVTTIKKRTNKFTLHFDFQTKFYLIFFNYIFFLDSMVYTLCSVTFTAVRLHTNYSYKLHLLVDLYSNLYF